MVAGHFMAMFEGWASCMHGVILSWAGFNVLSSGRNHLC